MKRALSSLLLVLVAIPSLAAPCVSSQNGLASAASTWGGSACNPTASDDVLIQQQHTVTWDVASMTMRKWQVYGIVNMLPAALGGRDLNLATVDGDGFDIQGTWNYANGTRVTFTANSGTPGLYSNNGGGAGNVTGDLMDLGPLRTVSALSINASSGVCISGDRWIVTTDIPTTGLAAGSILQFATGASKGRGYEIMAVTSTTLTICPSLPDGNSLGRRLTPHQSTGGTYVESAKIQLPGPGDRFWAWVPAVIRRTGSAKWIASNYGNSARYEFIGMDLSGWDTLWARCPATAASPAQFVHSNIHDGASLNNGIWFFGTLVANTGCDKALFSWNIAHDSSIADTHSFLAIDRETAGATVTAPMFLSNTFYRTQHNPLNVGFSSSTNAINRATVEDNTFFDMDSVGGGECFAMELDSWVDGVARFNQVWRASTQCGGIQQSTSITPSGNLVEGNFLEGGSTGIEVLSGKALCRNNYVVDMQSHGIWCWQADYNIIRDTNLTGREGMVRSVFAEGNVLNGLNSSDAGGSPQAVWGFEDTTTQFGNAGTVRKYRNNICRGLRNDGVVAPSCIYIQATDHSIDAEHNVMDCANASACSGVVEVNSGASQTFQVHDSVTINCPANGYAALSQAAAGATVNLVNLTRFPLTCPAAGGSVGGGGNWDVKAGEVNRDPLFNDSTQDWSLQSKSADLTAGSYPVGSAIGMRARRFDFTLLQAMAQSIMALNVPIPLDTLNEPVLDGDRDGFISFLRGDADSPDACPFLDDWYNGTNNSGVCKNASATAGKTFLKGGN